MTTLGGQASATGNPAIHPSRRWYWIAGGMIAGAVICIALAVAWFSSVNRQITDFQRVPAPGQAGVTFAQPGGYVLYIEKPGQCCSFSVSTGSPGAFSSWSTEVGLCCYFNVGTGSSPPFPSWSMQVALVPVSGGPQVSISTWQGATESYSIAGHQGQTAMYFTIDNPGRYLLATRNAAPGSITDVAVGRGIGRGILVPLVLIIAGSSAALAGLLTGVVTVFRRRRARRSGPVPPFVPPTGEAGPAVSAPSEHAANGHEAPPSSYLQGGPVGFGAAIRYGLRHWLVYRGRASRSAYWWFILFTAIAAFAVDIILIPIAIVISTSIDATTAAALNAVLIGVPVIYLGLVSLALTVRRLHDTGRSGWWVLIALVPFAGAITLLVFTLSEGTPEPNRYDAVAAHTMGAPGYRRDALVVIGAGLAALAVVVVAAVASSSPSSSSSTASSSPPSPRAPGSPTRSSSATSPPRQLRFDQLRAGDCLRLPHIDTISTWPDMFTAVPCTQPHTGEVFFAANIWPQSSAYPGDKAIGNQADARCGRAFTAYVGIPPDQSAFTYSDAIPDSTSWSSGDRSVQCIAYNPSGAPMSYSIKGTNK